MAQSFICTLTESETGTTFCKNVTIANSFLSRLIGLLGSHELPANHGLWLQPSNGIHTLFMRFPIDVVAFDRNGTVLKTLENVQPWRVVGVPLKTRSVLELPAGHLARYPLAVGQAIRANLVLAQSEETGRTGRPFLVAARPQVRHSFSFGFRALEPHR